MNYLSIPHIENKIDKEKNKDKRCIGMTFYLQLARIGEIFI